MTLKEQAYAIIDGFTEKQLKGFVDLFSDPEIDCEAAERKRRIDASLSRLTEIFLDGSSDPWIMNHIEEHLQKYRAKGYSEMEAQIYAFQYEIGREEVLFGAVMNLTKRGYALEEISKYLEIPLKVVKEMVDYLRLYKLIENETDKNTDSTDEKSNQEEDQEA